METKITFFLAFIMLIINKSLLIGADAAILVVLATHQNRYRSNFIYIFCPAVQPVQLISFMGKKHSNNELTLNRVTSEDKDFQDAVFQKLV